MKMDRNDISSAPNLPAAISGLGQLKPQPYAQKAWVVFSGQVDLPWLRILRSGFRHCFVLLHDGEGWLSVDPMLHKMAVHAHHHLPADFDLPQWLAQRGQKVVAVDIVEPQRRPAPWGLFTCVEAAKRILGIHARFVLTPWQLYRYLRKAKRVDRALPSGVCHFYQTVTKEI